MKASLVIPCYNESKNIPQLLESCRVAFNGKDIEVIIVNNGSTDNTQEVLNNNFKILKLKKKIHKGGISLNPKPFIKFIIYLISPKLYHVITNYFNKDNTKPDFPRIPWKDHILVIAQKK